MKRTPWVRHWLPTRMHKFAKYQAIIAKMSALDNVVVRLSSDSVLGETIKGDYTSTIVPSEDYLSNDMTLCEAYKNNGKCSGCRKCYDKNVSIVAYMAHGKTMQKVIRINSIH